MLEQINETVHFLKEKTNFTPETGIVLGSGLGGLADKIEKAFVIPYREIKNFPVSTVKGHGGNLIFGMLGGKKVVAMQGRFHYYEGYPMQVITFPIRVMRYLAIQQLILSNASGGVNPSYRVGDLMIVDDHINLMGDNPLTGRNEDLLGPRFPDMSAPYNKELIVKAKKIADRFKYRCFIGVYAAVTGPCYETRAEYRYVHTIGADAVGMSTVPEAIVARHMNLPCFAISVITDIGGGDHTEPVSHDEVVKVASEAEHKMTHIITTLIAES